MKTNKKIIEKMSKQKEMENKMIQDGNAKNKILQQSKITGKKTLQEKNDYIQSMVDKAKIYKNKYSISSDSGSDSDNDRYLQKNVETKDYFDDISDSDDFSDDEKDRKGTRLQLPKYDYDNFDDYETCAKEYEFDHWENCGKMQLCRRQSVSYIDRYFNYKPQCFVPYSYNSECSKTETAYKPKSTEYPNLSYNNPNPSKGTYESLTSNVNCNDMSEIIGRINGGDKSQVVSMIKSLMEKRKMDRKEAITLLYSVVYTLDVGLVSNVLSLISSDINTQDIDDLLIDLTYNTNGKNTKTLKEISCIIKKKFNFDGYIKEELDEAKDFT